MSITPSSSKLVTATIIVVAGVYGLVRWGDQAVVTLSSGNFSPNRDGYIPWFLSILAYLATLAFGLYAWRKSAKENP